MAKSLKIEEEGNETLAELNPKLQAVVEQLEGQEEMTAESVIAGVIEDGPMGAIGRKIIKYEAKELAIQDAIMVIRDCPLSVEETLQ